ncbi:unnamed protein product [Merluccius merluccius]
MARAIHSRPNMISKDTQGEREERIVDIYASPESLRDHHPDYVGTEDSYMTLRTVRSQSSDAGSPLRCLTRAVVVLLGLLSLILLAGLFGIVVQYKTILEKTLSMDRDMEQFNQRLKNLTEERDALLRQQGCPSP